MEDKKYSFSNVTLRIYSEELLKTAREVFKKTENQFANSKSAFVLYYFEKGLYADIKKDDGSITTNEDVLTEIQDLKKSVDALLGYLKAEKESTLTSSKNDVEIQGIIIDSLGKIASVLGVELRPIVAGK